MPNDTVIKLIQPGTFNDQLTDVLRTGARALLAQAVEAEVADFLGTHADLKTEDGMVMSLGKKAYGELMNEASDTPAKKK